MGNLTYPLLCWKLPEELILGQVIGLDLKAVDSQPRRLKTALTRQLQLDWREGQAEEPRIREAQLRCFKMMYRPCYREADGFYPSPYALEVPVVAVWGECGEGRWECFLPQLEEQFYLQEPGQLEILALHFAHEKLRRWPPDRLPRLLLPVQPWLEELTVRRTGRRTGSGADFQLAWRESPLAAVAEPYPPSRESAQQRRAIHGVWEREDEVARVKEELARLGANILLVGEPGVGKSAVLGEAIRQLHKESRELPARGRFTFWRTTPARLVAGSRYLGDWQERCDELVEALHESRGVLWLLHFPDLLRLGGAGPQDSMAAYLLPELQRGRLRIVAEVTPRELEAARALLPGFVNSFEALPIRELGGAQMKKVLDHFALQSRQLLEVGFPREALDLGFRLLSRHIRYERFPGKAATFLTACLNEAKRQKVKEVTPERVLEVFGEKTGLPEVLLHDDRLLDVDGLRDWFERRIIGQPQAIEVLTSVVKVFKVGLHHPGKPIACLVLAGPTGVGKTASARALADYFFGQGQKVHPLIRLDMSEYQHPFQIDRLIGSGRQGEPGQLVRQIRERPFSVVLLDEVEKAHPAFFDVLLAILDEGRLVDAFGRETDFCGTIVVLTTNLGAGAATAIGFAGSQPPDYAAVVRQFFRPEFYNRLDGVVAFRPLSAEVIATITRKELAELERRPGFRDRGIRLQFSEALVERLAREGFDPRLGARPLQRAIERLVVGPVARLILREPGLHDRTVHLDSRDGQLSIQT